MSPFSNLAFKKIEELPYNILIDATSNGCFIHVVGYGVSVRIYREYNFSVIVTKLTHNSITSIPV
jgi:hypothetical protein